MFCKKYAGYFKICQNVNGKKIAVYFKVEKINALKYGEFLMTKESRQSSSKKKEVTGKLS